jgi:lysophospholipase L1-like esterase
MNAAFIDLRAGTIRNLAQLPDDATLPGIYYTDTKIALFSDGKNGFRLTGLDAALQPGLTLPSIQLGLNFDPPTDVVICAPYDAATTGTANFGGTSGETAKEWIGVGHLYRIRQNGSLSRVKFYLGSITGMTGFYLKIWRAKGTLYDLVGTSGNLLSSLAAGRINTIDLAMEIDVAEGDYIGARVTWTSASAFNFYARTSVAGVTTYSVNNATPASIGFNWAAQTAAAGTIVPIEVHNAGPMFVTIGDSIISGAMTNFSFADSYSSTTDVTASLAYYIGHALDYDYQNMGQAGQTTAGIAARFRTDVVNLAPRFCVIEGGVNDILSSITSDVILANWEKELDHCISNGILPVVILIMPFRRYGAATNAMLQQRDLFNANLRALAEKYSAVIVDSDPYLGKCWPGGDPGNLWQLQLLYDSGDGVHLSPTGYERLAMAVLDAMSTTRIRGAMNLSSLSLQGNLYFAGVRHHYIQSDRCPLYQSAGFPLTLYAGGSSACSTDTNGGDLELCSGIATGAGSSHVLIKVPIPGTSGGADNLPVTCGDWYSDAAGTFQKLIAATGKDAVFRPYSGNTYEGGAGYCAAANSFALYANVDGATPIVLIGANVAIGTGTTAANNAKLEIRGPSGTDQNAAILKAYSAAGRGIWMAYDSTNSRAMIGAVSEGISHDTILLAPIGGNVGIGVSGATPTDKLHIKTSSIAVVRLEAATGNDAVFRAYSGSTYMGGAGYSSGANCFAIFSHLDASTPAMTVAANVGIGTGTATASAKLEVRGSTGTDQNAAIIKAYAATGRGLWISYDTSGSRALIGAISEGASHDPILLEPLGGNVGIGISGASPLDKLHVKGSAGTYVRLEATAADAHFRAYDGVNYKGGVGYYQAGNLFGVYGKTSGSAPVIRLDTSVGIDINPSTTAKLLILGASGTDQSAAIVKMYASSSAGIWSAYSTTNNKGYLGAIREGVSHDNLAICPLGGTVELGANIVATAAGGINAGSATDPGLGVISALVGFRVANAALAGKVLRGDGTNFVAGTLGSGDLSNSTFVTSVTGTANRITSTGGLTPVIDISSSYVGQASITTLGTIATGIWQGTTVAVNKGGTGQTSYTDGQLLIGNSTGNTLAKATLTAGSNVTITNGAGAITINATSGSTSPAGADTQVQFNNAGVFGASSGLTWDNIVNRLTIGGSGYKNGRITDSAANLVLDWSPASSTQIDSPLGQSTEIRCAGGTIIKLSNPGTQQIGFFGATPVAMPIVSGSRGGNAALASALTALANLGLIFNNSTA